MLDMKDTKTIAKWILNFKKYEIIISLICLICHILFDNIGSIIGIILIIPSITIHIVSFLFFFIWIYCSIYNCRNLSLSSTKFSPIMAIVWFFIPIINWFYSVLIVQNIWEVNYRFNSNKFDKPQHTSTVTLWGIFRLASFIAAIFNVYNISIYLTVDIIYMLFEYSIVKQIADLQDQTSKNIESQQMQNTTN